MCTVSLRDKELFDAPSWIDGGSAIGSRDTVSRKWEKTRTCACVAAKAVAIRPQLRAKPDVEGAGWGCRSNNNSHDLHLHFSSSRASRRPFPRSQPSTASSTGFAHSRLSNDFPNPKINAA